MSLVSLLVKSMRLSKVSVAAWLDFFFFPMAQELPLPDLREAHGRANPEHGCIVQAVPVNSELPQNVDEKTGNDRNQRI